MKTPEEIKEGLVRCVPYEEDESCSECPYKREGNSKETCYERKTADTIAYIEQLEMLAKPNNQIQWERDVAIKQLEELGVGFGEKIVGKVPKWISVEERLPEQFETVIACTDKGTVCAAQHWGEAGWKREMMGYCRSELAVSVTHWMPLPEPPKEDTSE